MYGPAGAQAAAAITRPSHKALFEIPTDATFPCRPGLGQSLADLDLSSEPSGGRSPDVLNQRLRVPDVGSRRRTKNDGLKPLELADPLDRIGRRDGTGREDRHGDRPASPTPERLKVCVDAPRHPEADLVDVS